MKAILMSIKPRFVVDILNGKKTIEIRKRFPKDYRGWVYIYCTKKKPRAILTDKGCVVANTLTVGGNSQYKSGYSLSGEVVARFYCDNVEEIKTDYAPRDTFFKECCLTPIELFDYIGHSKWYAIHISQLEIFDEPKNVDYFHKKDCSKCPFNHEDMDGDECTGCLIDRAPQSWQYIKV